MSEASRELIREFGCKGWQVPAALAEAEVMDALYVLRAGAGFVEAFSAANQRHAALLRDLLDRQHEFGANARRWADRREKRLIDFRETRGSAGSTQYVTEANRALLAAEDVLIGLREDEDALHAELGRLIDVSTAAQSIARRWQQGPEERRKLLDTWIDRICVEILGSRPKGGGRRLWIHTFLIPGQPLPARDLY